MKRSSTWSCAVVALASVIGDVAPATPPIEPKTTAAVLAADNAWTAAEIRGDAAFVDQLLLPGYRSIGASGTVSTKAVIVAHARERGPNSDFGAQVAAYKAGHPTRGDVAIFGDVAVLNWISVSPGKNEPVASCDIFVYRDGHWRALYSQHTTAEL